mgnify:FL=1
MRFAGKYALHTDEKGRLRLPQFFRARMGTSKIYAMYSAGGCVSFIREEEADKLFAHFEGMITVADSKVLASARLLMAYVSEITEDSQGRFTLPPDLKKMADLGRDVIFVGMGNKVELWDAKRFEDNINGVEYEYPYMEKFAQISEEIVF